MERMTRNRWLYRLLIIFIFVLSNIMCIVVCYNWAFMECGIRYRGFSAPAYTALFSGIPYFIALIGCIVGVVVLHKNLKNKILRIP